MSGLGNQLQQGVGDAARAMSADVGTGLQNMAKDTAAQTMEVLTGGVIASDSGKKEYMPGVAGAPTEQDEFASYVQQRRAADARRLKEVQAELEQVVNRQKKKEEQRTQAMAEEAIEEKREVAEKKQKQGRLEQIMGRIRGQWGGSGEIRGGVN